MELGLFYNAALALPPPYILFGKCHNIDNSILNKSYVNTSITRIMNQGKAILGVDKVKR